MGNLYGPPVLRPAEIKKLLAAPDARSRVGRKHAAMLAILTGAGLRLSEARQLRMSNLERDGGRIRLTFRTLKQRRVTWRTVTLAPWATTPLNRWLTYSRFTPDAYLFPGKARGSCMSLSGTERILERYLAAIGRDDLHGHSLRHTFGALVTKSTRSIFVAQMLLGHSSPITTSRYYSVFEVSDADDAADALSFAKKRQPRINRPERELGLSVSTQRVSARR